MESKDTSVVICCAGMGSRLGIGTPKALIDVDGQPIIYRQLDLLQEFDDIRIVVGFQAERVINTVNKYRNDIVYAFNYDYEHTDIAESLKKGLLGVRENVLIMDGGVVICPEDFQKIVHCHGECVCFCVPSSSSPVFTTVENGNVTGFSTQHGNYEWCGIAKVRSSKLVLGKKYIYEMIADSLPITGLEIRAKDIDTPEDYENMLEWLHNGYTEKGVCE